MDQIALDTSPMFSAALIAAAALPHATILMANEHLHVLLQHQALCSMEDHMASALLYAPADVTCQPLLCSACRVFQCKKLLLQ